MGYLQLAEEYGQFKPGWCLLDYLKDSIWKYGWEEIVIWGQKGGGKSNMLLQLGFLLLGDWDKVLEFLVFTPNDFKRVTEGEERVTWLGWDDITVHLPRTLYFTNRKLYIELQKNWAAYRVEINTFICTTPRKKKILDFMLEDLTGEIYVGKPMTLLGEEVKEAAKRADFFSRYEVQKHIPLIDVSNPKSDKCFLALIERDWLPFTPKVADAIAEMRSTTSTPFDGVPTDVFREYWSRRIELAEQAKPRLYEAFEQVESRMPLGRFYTVQQVMRILNIKDKQTVYKMIKTGMLKYIRTPGGKYLIPEKSILDLMKEPLEDLPDQVKTKREKQLERI